MNQPVKIGDATLYLGDCLAVLPTLADGSVDAVVTDPPYGLGIDYDGYQDTRDALARLVAGFIPQARRVARRVFVTPGQTQMTLYPEPDWVLAVTWNTTGTFGKYGYSQWMPVLAYGPDLAGFGSVGGVLKSDLIQIGGGSGVGFMRQGEAREHPCPKPANVMRLLIQRLTAPDETVLDPFMGSGTTGVAAVGTRRRFIGCELSPAYFDLACRRVREAQGMTGLFAPKSPEPTLFPDHA